METFQLSGLIQSMDEHKKNNINGLVQERHNSSALAMELRLSCTNTTICFYTILEFKFYINNNF